MCAPSAPAAPDYAGAAAQQAASSKEIATQNTFANRPEQFTPWGANRWNSYADVDPSSGQQVTRWVQTQQLNPQLQSALNDQIAIQQDRSNLAGGFAGRVAESYAQPFDWTNIPGQSGTPQARLTGTYGPDATRIDPTTQTTNAPAFTSERQRIENALFDRMRPEQQYQEDRTRTMLANQGLTPGSEAYNRELQRLHEQQAGERFNALQMGGQEQARLQQMLLSQQQQAFTQTGQSQDAYNRAAQQAFGQDFQANQQNYQQMIQQADYQNKLRQAAIAEQQLQRGMSLNELNAILTGQQVAPPQMPQFQSAMAPQPLQSLAAATAQGNFNTAAAQAEAQGSSGMWGGLGSLAGTIGGIYGMGGFGSMMI